jgi:hypothetical protein
VVRTAEQTRIASAFKIDIALAILRVGKFACEHRNSYALARLLGRLR